jgi:S1-C subfamily serine protease
MMGLRAAALVFLIVLAWPARADEDDAALLSYAVAINQAAQSRAGTGIYFGNGYVLTASHVVGGALLKQTNVTIAGRDLPARVVKQDAFEQSDLALLAIDDRELPTTLRLQRISLCKDPPWPGQDVITVIPEEAVHSHVLSPIWLPLDARQYKTVISDVARTGNSGAGVFDAQEGCLLGIMSRKISQVFTDKNAGGKEIVDIAKYFVPAAAITEFLPKEILEVEP